MDAKSRANFINSVASGSNVPCPDCGTSNEAGTQSCAACGTPIADSQAAKNSASAFQPVKEAGASKRPGRYAEPANVFAQGLPEWSIEPPQVMVRRR